MACDREDAGLKYTGLPDGSRLRNVAPARGIERRTGEPGDDRPDKNSHPRGREGLVAPATDDLSPSNRRFRIAESKIHILCNNRLFVNLLLEREPYFRASQELSSCCHLDPAGHLRRLRQVSSPDIPATLPTVTLDLFAVCGKPAEPGPQNVGRHHRLEHGAGGAADRGVPSGGQKPDRHRSPWHQPGRSRRLRAQRRTLGHSRPSTTRCRNGTCSTPPLCAASG